MSSSEFISMSKKSGSNSSFFFEPSDRYIQNLRKESGLNVTDRIKLTVSGDDELKSAFQMFETFVAGEVLASSSVFADNITGGTEVESEDKKWSISIEKA